ncbi:hypothetical protein G7B40_031030 [Aetokthonos hydrillicola Thurmond2011]|jgi:hypothetical protein|uniref:Uncharacterized protein n=1 Tax=Aetokthonos hydrillicola Thurmond2011 TaxID=2712845 RepID=A0AAP5IEL6_9CYAN|nr:hypothetical protein [Aetokthonos hydrillicola]MBO3462111.1 hypothetical protein [Aetokthonos hydrillicola CCALA 1050]MBW4589705.1 hypothetical protein [Aetokthonos hydrillicola CCALA 1050]MDR9898959.1 hypothetical protein [Aetokthonos hydrillicola Thurmond2011]
MSIFLIVENVEYQQIYTDAAYSGYEIDKLWETDLLNHLSFICIDPRINLEPNLDIENEIVSITKDRSRSRNRIFDVMWKIRVTTKARLLIDAPSMEQAESTAESWLGQTIAIVPSDEKLIFRFNPDDLKLNFHLSDIEQLPSKADSFRLEEEEILCPLLCPFCSHKSRCSCDFDNQMEKNREYIEKSYGLNHEEAFFTFHSPAGTLHNRLGNIVKYL